MRRTLRPILLFLLMATPAAADSSRDPKLLAQDYVAALKESQWGRIADMMDPRELTEVHGFVIPVLKRLVVQRRAWPAPFKQMMAGLETPVQVGKLTPRQVFVRLLEGTVRSIGGGRALDTATFTVLGQVNETPTLVHVVYRAQFKLRGVAFSSLSVISMARHEGRWRIKLNENMRQVAAVFQRLAKKL
jgi:hypothetical protein